LFKAFQKEFVDLLVPLGKLSEYFLEEWADSLFRKRHDSGNDATDPLRISRTERP
jgi:hypothetical protein